MAKAQLNLKNVPTDRILDAIRAEVDVQEHALKLALAAAHLPDRPSPANVRKLVKLLALVQRDCQKCEKRYRSFQAKAT